MQTKTSRSLVALLLAISLSPIFAQNQVTGAITDSKKESLPGASILLLAAADSSLVLGRLSSDAGRFSFENVESGRYFLKISMLGLADFFSEKFELGNGSPRKDFGKIELADEAAQLREVEVAAKKPLFQQKVDRVLVNVAASATNAGGNALQVLQKSPGVMVNRQAGISIAGKNGIIIMVNGKINRMPPEAVMQMLEGTSSDNIERIEIIHTPPANFDAEGNAGIINIVLKQTADAGLNGGYSLAAGYGKREKWGANAFFNFRKGKMNLFGNHDYSFDYNPQIFTNYRGIERDGQFLETDGSSNRRPTRTGIHNSRLGADFQLSEKTVVGVVGTFFDRNWEMLARNDIENRVDGTVASRVFMTTNELNHWQSATGNVNFSHQFDKSKTLTADADYVFYKIDNPSDYDIENRLADESPTSSSQLRVSKENPISIRVGKLDYVQNFGENTRLETGLKGAASRFDNDVQVESRLQNEAWQLDSALTSRFKLREDVLAAYATVSFKIGKKTDGKLGLRHEYTTTNLGSAEQPNVVDRRYGSWFPTVYLARTISEKQSLNLSYSRRIARPGFTQLAPYLIFYDPSTSQNGNPALQPAFVDALRAGWQIGGVMISGEYNLEKPSIRDIPVVNVEANSHVTQPVNLGETHNFFGNITFPKEIKPWWRVQASLFFVYQKFNFELDGLRSSIPSRFGWAHHSQSFTFKKGWSADIEGFIVTENYWGLTKYRPFGSLALGLRKDLGERWGTLSFNLNDVFQSNNFFGSVEQPDLNIRVKSSYQQAERTFRISWSSKFGNRKLREARQRERGASEELRRL